MSRTAHRLPFAGDDVLGPRSMCSWHTTVLAPVDPSARSAKLTAAGRVRRREHAAATRHPSSVNPIPTADDSVSALDGTMTSDGGGAPSEATTTTAPALIAVTHDSGNEITSGAGPALVHSSDSVVEVQPRDTHDARGPTVVHKPSPSRSGSRRRRTPSRERRRNSSLLSRVPTKGAAAGGPVPDPRWIDKLLVVASGTRAEYGNRKH
jgi:hypothetical protein